MCSAMSRCTGQIRSGVQWGTCHSGRRQVRFPGMCGLNNSRLTAQRVTLINEWQLYQYCNNTLCILNRVLPTVASVKSLASDSFASARRGALTGRGALAVFVLGRPGRGPV